MTAIGKRYVTRSAFQKKSEECKRLKKDIYEIVMGSDSRVWTKWVVHFEKEKEFTKLLREAVLQHIGKTAKGKLKGNDIFL